MNWHEVLVVPWTDGLADTQWIVLMGFLTCVACGLPGCFVVLRKQAMVGDALSHSLLPGLVVAFLVAGTRDPWAMLLGGLGAGLLCVVVSEFLHRRARLSPDMALGATFSVMFALGVVLVAAGFDNVDLDADCVLYGDLAFIGFEPFAEVFGHALAPEGVVRMAVVLAVVAALLGLFYKELVVTTFDPGLARTLGISPMRFHYGLLVALTAVLVFSFSAVGAILAVGMTAFPGATMVLWTKRLHWVLAGTVLLAAIYALAGFHLASALSTSIAAGMVVVAFAVFLLTWLAGPRHGLLWRLLRRPPAGAPAPTP